MICSNVNINVHNLCIMDLIKCKIDLQYINMFITLTPHTAFFQLSKCLKQHCKGCIYNLMQHLCYKAIPI